MQAVDTLQQDRLDELTAEIVQVGWLSGPYPYGQDKIRWREGR